MTGQYSFFTFANGKKYLDMAFALARSYRFHNDTDITFAIVSNNHYSLPADLRWVKKTIVPQTITGPGLEFKLHLLDLAPTERSIFLDADSLVYGRITDLFQKFTDKPSVIGLKVTEGSWVDEDIAAACTEFNLDYMVRYCGAFYYLVKNHIGEQVFDTAKALYQSGRKFQRNERTMYDEPILSVALSEYQAEPLTDDGNIWGDLAQWDYNTDINVFKSPPIFSNEQSNRNYKFWLPTGTYSPRILHVGSGNHNKKPWVFDASRLKLYYKFKLPRFMANGLVYLFLQLPYTLIRNMANQFKR